MGRRRIERHRPVGLFGGEPMRSPAVEHVRIERDVARAGGIELAHGAQKDLGVDAVEHVCQHLERIRLRLGDAPNAILAAQQRRGLGVEYLPREHAWLTHDRAAVFGIGMAVKVGALVDVALAPGIDEDAERIIVLLELVADGEVAIGRGVDVPGDGMTAGPITVGPRARRERHADAGAHVEARAADLR